MGAVMGVGIIRSSMFKIEHDVAKHGVPLKLEARSNEVAIRR